MKNILYISTTVFLLSASAMLCAEEPSSPKEWSVSSVSENPKLEITVRGYPDVIQFGDTLHLICTFKNVGDQVIDDVMVSLQYEVQFYKFPFIHNMDANEIYTQLPDVTNRSVGRRIPTLTTPLHPGESRLMYVHSFELPLLEDMNAPFWKNLLADFWGSDRKCTLQVPTAPSERGISPERVLTHGISIKPRSDTEMALLDFWLSQSRIEYLSFVNPDYKDHLIVVDGFKYNPQQFIRTGNRKPPVDLCPKTWQGWKELEESIVPGTMRDEIRLTRIFIQYCDTKDEKVLDELKEWFAEMNEIQRAGMARLTYNRSFQFVCASMLPLYRNLYLAIREYDISYKSGGEIYAMKRLGWIE
jgi:hypothetical protein